MNLAGLFVVVAWLLAAAFPAAAQTASDPQPLPQAQFDAIVSATKKAVLDELKDPKAAPPGAAAADSTASADDEAATLLGVFGDKLLGVLSAMPTVVEGFADLGRSLDGREAGGRGRGTFLLLLLAGAALALIVEASLRALATPWKRRFAAKATPDKGLPSLIYLGLVATFDLAAVLGLWLCGHLWLVGGVLQASPAQQRFALAVLGGVLTWRLYALILRVIVRPDVPATRLCSLDDRGAASLYARTLTFLALTIALRLIATLLLANGAPDAAVIALRLLTSPIVLIVLLWLVVTVQPAMRQWLSGLGETARFADFIGRHWLGIMVPFVVALVATQLYGVISGRRDVPTALLLTINLFAALLLFETLLQAVVRRLDSQLAGFTPASAAPTLADVVARCIRVAALIFVLVLVAESWVVNVLGLVDAHAWKHIARESRTAGATLFVAFVLWEAFRYATDSYLRRHVGADSSTTTRLGTLIPLLRVTVAIVLAVVAVLIALENIGVNVTPLLAGASVLGLALSFGSQTLVKDIVSGIFYLTDDAFRVGESISCDKARGTVEGFTLRSVRLRNANGQIHTVPFGDLGQVTNFSRDWSGADFSLRFARDTDLEKLRSATAEVGAEIAAMPGMADLLLEPLKMAGIAEIADSALVVRFKFVAKPGATGKIQNEAMTRLLQALPAQGIVFAG